MERLIDSCCTEKWKKTQHSLSSRIIYWKKKNRTETESKASVSTPEWHPSIDHPMLPSYCIIGYSRAAEPPSGPQAAPLPSPQTLPCRRWEGSDPRLRCESHQLMRIFLPWLLPYSQLRRISSSNAPSQCPRRWFGHLKDIPWWRQRTLLPHFGRCKKTKRMLLRQHPQAFPLPCQKIEQFGLTSTAS